MTSLGLMELLLVSVPQHGVHHTAAVPHVKQGLPVLVSHLLQRQPSSVRRTLNSRKWKRQRKTNCRGRRRHSQRSRQTCQSPECRNGRWEAGCTRSNRCLWPAPAAAHSTRKRAAFGSLPCSGPERKKDWKPLTCLYSFIWWHISHFIPKRCQVKIIVPWLSRPMGLTVSTAATSRSDSPHSWSDWFHSCFQHQWRWRPWLP